MHHLQPDSSSLLSARSPRSVHRAAASSSQPTSPRLVHRTAVSASQPTSPTYGPTPRSVCQGPCSSHDISFVKSIVTSMTSYFKSYSSLCSWHVTSTKYVINETQSSDRKENENPVTYVSGFFLTLSNLTTGVLCLYVDFPEVRNSCRVVCL